MERLFTLSFHQYTNKLSEHTNLIITQSRLGPAVAPFPPSADFYFNNDSANLYSSEAALCQRQREDMGANPGRVKASGSGSGYLSGSPMGLCLAV